MPFVSEEIMTLLFVVVGKYSQRVLGEVDRGVLLELTTQRVIVHPLVVKLVASDEEGGFPVLVGHSEPSKG